MTLDAVVLASALLLQPALVINSPAQSEKKQSPDRTRYVVAEEGQRVGKGEEVERLVVFTAAGAQVTVAHVWLIEPDGSRRAGIRGCEEWGWIDNARLFCSGSINPSTVMYLVFDAKTGDELDELTGSNWVWSPDGRLVASFGNVPHFTDADQKSHSIELQGKQLFPRSDDRELHWFRSLPVWAADSQSFALVDHRQKQNAFVLIVATAAGRISEFPMTWKSESVEWPAPRDFELQWQGKAVRVRHLGVEQIVKAR